MSLFHNYFKGLPTTELLRVTHYYEYGNLLEGSDEGTHEAQVECWRWLISTRQPKNFLEIGTNKAYVSWLIKLTYPDVRVVTVDQDNDCRRCADIVGVKFVVGDSKVVVPALTAVMDFQMVYIDGDHTKSGCLADIRNCVEAKIPCITVDDTKSITAVTEAVREFDWKTYGYSVVYHPFWTQDSRGIMIYESEGDHGLSDLFQ